MQYADAELTKRATSCESSSVEINVASCYVSSVDTYAALAIASVLASDSMRDSTCATRGVSTGIRELPPEPMPKPVIPPCELSLAQRKRKLANKLRSKRG